MSDTVKKKWKTLTTYGNGWTFARPNFRKVAFDIALKAAGAALCYTAGMFAGDLLEQVPYVNQAVPQAVEYVSDIDIASNIGGLTGLIGGLYGLVYSGSKIGDDPDRLESITISSVKLYQKK
ncbi:TPA: hypothetical protein HA239_03865 [Candidatus Woesearchaeota archaeon]|nr:hypothetical protein QT06_C0001G0809 [archaeon GW2011_AR15]MBS3103411.1 hypothetical protein [Candidatus Woesearchaeota archaeon]HIH41528.1 hypothetical protein [Candidatus Woesearchaeota archaeon]